MAVANVRIDLNGYNPNDIVHISTGWDKEHRVGEVVATSFIMDGLGWTAVRWIGDADPDFHKTRGLTLIRRKD